MPTLYINDSTKKLYLKRFIGKIYKILPMFEESGFISDIYIYGVLLDINSANELFDGILIEVIVKINSLYKAHLTHRQIKKIVLECTNMLKAIEEGLSDE